METGSTLSRGAARIATSQKGNNSVTPW
jgi:hypothetical protein